ncbi:hypothetical protein ACRRTK_013485 [Alexandromys fortis]
MEAVSRRCAATAAEAAQGDPAKLGSQIIKVEAIMKYGLVNERKTKSSEPTLRTRVFHCQAACARLSPSHTSTRVTWGRGCLRACASQADGDQLAPA